MGLHFRRPEGRTEGDLLSSPYRSSYDRHAVAAEEDLRARAVLAEMQMRISQGPYSALSISEDASAEQVRAAFLQLTKQFHPARFGRMSAEVHRLANEVFLGIKGAHDQLTKLLGSSGRVTSARVGTAPSAATGGTVRGTGLVPKAQPVNALTRGSDRPVPHRQSSPGMTPPGAPRGGSSLTTPAGGIRMPSPLQSTQPMPRTTPSAGVPVQRFPSSEPEKKPTPPSGIPGQPRPTSPQGIPRPATPQNPSTVRYAGAAQSSSQLPKAGASSEDPELRHAMDLLSSKDWNAARLAFHALAAKVPQSRQYRALLCYARGRETQATGRPDDAMMEFQRALQLDPDLQLAKDAIRELGRKSRW
jgi:hypothetical protein